MHRFSIPSAVALSLSIHLSVGMAAAPVLGVAISRGSFAINQAAMEGNATLFEGNRVETGGLSSELRLNNGVRMRLASESSGIVYRDRLVLERGGSEVIRSWDAAAGPYRVEAGPLRIQPLTAGSAGARVALEGDHVKVAALASPLTVTNRQGVLLAKLAAGRSAEFTPDLGSGPSTLTGCVTRHKGKYWLSDEASSVEFEVVGGGVAQQVGNRVAITGTVKPGSRGGTEGRNVLQVSAIRQFSKGCAAAAGSVAAAAAGTTAVTSTPVKASTAVIAGVVVAAGGSIAAIALTGSDDEKATISPSTR